MNKSRTGSYTLAFLVALQVCSIPEFVDSGWMLRFASLALLGYIAFVIMLLWFAARNARALSFRPRFWTLSNLTTFVLLGIATWTAWRTNCRRVEITMAAAALVASLVHLHWRNARNQIPPKNLVPKCERHASR